MTKRKQALLSIGRVAERTGCSVSALRFYEEKGLLRALRTAGGKRIFNRSDIRRVSFILICQRLGYTLEDIRKALATLPDERTPNKADWRRLSKQFSVDIDRRIQELEQLKDRLTGCIGCGCLSLNDCKLFNPNDRAEAAGEGPRFLLGDQPTDFGVD